MITKAIRNFYRQGRIRTEGQVLIIPVVDDAHNPGELRIPASQVERFLLSGMRAMDRLDFSRVKTADGHRPRGERRETR